MKNFWVVVVLFLFVWGCKKTNTVEQNNNGQDTSVPNLAQPICSFASVTRFIPFGTGSGSNLSTGYEFHFSNTNQTVVAACNGIVSDISGNTITIKYKKNSIYSFKYIGIGTVQVHVNDSLSFGAILGKLSSQGVLGFEMIKNDNTALCPQTYGGPGFNNAVQVAIDQHNSQNPDSVSTPCLQSSVNF